MKDKFELTKMTFGVYKRKGINYDVFCEYNSENGVTTIKVGPSESSIPVWKVESGFKELPQRRRIQAEYEKKLGKELDAKR